MNRKLTLIAVIPSLLLFMSIVIYRQSIAQESCPEKSIKSSHSKDMALSGLTSPHEIALYINEHNDEANLNDLWNKLGIDTDFGKPGRCGCRGYDCPGTCKAEVIQIDLGRDQVNLSILKISYAGDTYCWFLVFKKEPGWEVLGVVESLENQYKPPQHRIVRHDSQRWLVIKELCGRGTGFVNYVERWHQLSSKAPKEVLSYGVSGHSVQGDASDYEFESEIIEHEDGSNYKLEVRYKVFRGLSDQPNSQWDNYQEYKACFVWDSVLEQFILDNMSSNLPKSEDDPIIRNLTFPRRVEGQLSLICLRHNK